jgi:DNA-binding response OmpR family regulator
MATGRRTILMVEDEESITIPLAEALEREGLDTRVTGPVREALESTEQALPDLVLLDVMLLDGSAMTSAGAFASAPGCRSSC